MVRVYDQQTKTYFRSEVYANINFGWYNKQLVRVPCQTGDYLRLYEYTDKESPQHTVLINQITPRQQSDWIYEKSPAGLKMLSEYVRSLDQAVLFFSYSGPAWLFEDKETMVRLLMGESIPVRGGIFENRVFSDYLDGWNYIDSQSDIDRLMEQMAGFHDSVIKSIHYVSGSYGHGDGSLFPIDNERRTVIIIDSQWSDSIEMVFDGTIALNLRPAPDNYDALIYSTTLSVKDCIVYFSDGGAENSDCTWIKAYSLRWRLIRDDSLDVTTGTSKSGCSPTCLGSPT